MGKSQKPEQDIFTQNQVENFNNLSRVLGKNFRLKLNPTIKLNYHRKTSTLSFFSKITKKRNRRGTA